MACQVLERLKTDEFALTFSFVSSPRAIHLALQRSEEVEKLRLALSSGEVTEQSIRGFSADLLRELERGKRLEHELALAAIAVAFESRHTLFAEEFVLDLARLELAELPIAFRVARAVCHARLSLPANKSKMFTISDETANSEWRAAPKSRQVAVGQADKCFEFEAY